MQPFRTIQPAPLKRDGKRDGEGDKQPGPGLRPRIVQVVQACGYCRRSKTKCDGQRPKCRTCIVKGQECGYEGDAGQSRPSAARSRLELLENLIDSLRTRPPDQADLLYHRIRSADDLVRVFDAFKLGDDLDAGSGQVGPLLPESLRQGESANENLSVTATVDRREPRDLSPGSTAQSIRLLLPSAAVTTQALDSFFSCSGKICHVFSGDQVAERYRAVFHGPHSPAESSKSDLCSLMAVAAVGAQYVHGQDGQFDKQTEDAFYDLARYSFEDILERQPFEAIKICTLFAHYNILEKTTIALSYVEIGLALARKLGLSTRASRPSFQTNSEWIDYRKTWRTLMFFSSWLTSTLGYISGNDILANRVQLSEIGLDTSSDIADIVQTELAKICLLKADILRMHLAFKELTLLSLESIRKDLLSWYQDLPGVMRLGYTGRADPSLETRRSILHVHLLYLGAIMLLHRRLACQFIRSSNIDQDRDMLKSPMEGLLNTHCNEGALAASSSARILKLMLEDGCIFKRCWLVIFQAYTSCVIILHSVSQKQLHGFNPLTWKEDMEHVQYCLSALEYCGTVDEVASKFHGQLRVIFEDLRDQKQDDPGSGGSQSMDIDAGESGSNNIGNPLEAGPNEQQKQCYDYLLRLPAGADSERLNLSRSLLVMLCQPFGDPSNKPLAEVNVKEGWRGDPTRYEYPQMVERLDWAFESSMPFQWDFGATIAFEPRDGQAASDPTASRDLGEQNQGRHHFIGSSAPWWWIPAPPSTMG